MHLAKALERVRRINQKLRLPGALAALALGLLAGAPARSECVSPSADAGATTTMVFPCQDGDASAKQAPLQAPVIVDPGKGPVIVDPGNSTVVERGSADVPWFEPKPTTTADPITTPKAEPETKVKAAKAAPEPVPVKAPEKKAEPKEEVVSVEPVPEETPEEKPAVEATPAKAKVTKAKRTKKLAKSKRSKKFAFGKKRSKVSKAKVATQTPAKSNVVQPEKVPEQEQVKKRTKSKTAKPDAAPEQQQVKTEPANSDDKVIVMTRKNTPIGSRIKNWLGL